MDTEIAELILGLQMQDLNDALANRKGKAPETQQLSDGELALRSQQDEFERTLGELTDARMAKSIGRAVQDDGACVVILAGDESRAAADRELACRLSGQTPQAIAHTIDLKADDDSLSMYSALNAGDFGDDDDDTASVSVIGESSALAARGRGSHSAYRAECVVCREEDEVVRMPCSEWYCRRCTVRLFEEATTDETLFPPRCCRQTIPISSVRQFLGKDLATRIEHKAIEYGTTNRTYCCNPACATFIEPGHINGASGTCPNLQCRRETCVLCKKPSHDGDCPTDDSMEAVLQLAQSEGWQRCSACMNMVELRTGCNHMT